MQADRFFAASKSQVNRAISPGRPMANISLPVVLTMETRYISGMPAAARCFSHITRSSCRRTLAGPPTAVLWRSSPTASPVFSAHRLARACSRSLLSGDTSVNALALPGPVFLAQHILLHLAGRGFGQGTKAHGGGTLEMGHALAAEGDNLGFGRALALFERHKGFGALTPGFVGDGNDRAFEHGRMLGDDLLDLDS